MHTPLAVAAVAAGAIAAVLLAGCGRKDDAITRAAKRPGAAVSCRPSRSAPVYFERYHPEQGTATSQDDVCFTAVNPGGWMPPLGRYAKLSIATPSRRWPVEFHRHRADAQH